MSYPYGRHNSATLELLKKFGCAIGLTTQVGLASELEPLTMKRLDTNDLPFSMDAEICEWTIKASKEEVVIEHMPQLKLYIVESV